MNPDKISTIKRLSGDAADVKETFDRISEILKKEDKLDDDIILFQLRKIVDRCDYISLTIEKEFRDE